MRVFLSFCFFISSICIFVGQAQAEDKTPPARYKRHDIAVSRFGEGPRQTLLKRAYGLKAAVDAQIVGQERATKALQDRVVQYIENFGTRTRDPVAVHLIGLPGIGKSVMLDELERLGFEVVRVDAQIYANRLDSDPTNDLYLKSYEKLASGKPVIFLFDEIDKLPEMTPQGEVTRPFIGMLNQILTEGKVSMRNAARGAIDFSNVMVITTMNFSPEEIELFSTSALPEKKSFYDFTIEDFAAFDAWLTQNPGARYKVLSHLFRSNTVSRLAPNTVIMKPLEADDYAKIVRLNIERAIERATSGKSAGKRIEVTYTDAFARFVFERTVFAPSGARETVYKADALADQVIQFATKALDPKTADSSLDRPRRIQLDADSARELALVEITPRILKQAALVDGDPFRIEISYDPNSRLFIQPQGIALSPPASIAVPEKPGARERKLTKKEILAARFPRNQKSIKGLARNIDQTLLGQEHYSRLVEKEFNAYMGRKEPAIKQPPFMVLSGFPGIGKSELVALTARYLDLPVARINMQQFASDAPETLANFVSTLQQEVYSAMIKSKKEGKFIILFEELDKVFEISPTGSFVNRPVMAIIKDLLNEGMIKVPAAGNDSGGEVIDIRKAYTMVTMNFAVDRFGFEADPRLTSIEDVLSAWKRLSASMADLKKVLGSMFLPETVSRLIPRFHVMKPLEAEDYRKIIEQQAEHVIAERLQNHTTKENTGAIEVRLTPAYRRYLYNETVIPSEGARNTVVASRGRIGADLELALARIPRSSAIAAKPLEVTLDFRPATSTVVAYARALDAPEGEKRIKLFASPVELAYPPLNIKGQIPEERLLTSVHEFGHAFTAIRLGLRFEYATVVPPKAGVGGYVKYKHPSMTAKTLLARIYSALGSRAMERIFLSGAPRESGSVLDITHGASNDIMQATSSLWTLLYEVGFDPLGGTIERKGVEGMNRYAHFADLPAEQVERLGLVLREMENQIVADLLKAHEQEWYREKILEFARKGGLNEVKFYEMIGYPHGGDNAFSLGEESRLQLLFEGVVKETPPEVRKAAAFEQGATGTTARQNLEAYTAAFTKLVARRLHGNAGKIAAGFRASKCAGLLTK